MQFLVYRLGQALAVGVIPAFLTTLVGCGGNTSDKDDKPVAPAPPVIEPIADSLVAVSNQVVIHAHASDPNGDALTFKWEQASGTTLAQVSGANSDTITVRATGVREDLVFHLTVTDSTGASSQADAKVLVRNPSSSGPLPLQLNRRFTYKIREEVYPWIKPGSGEERFMRATNPREVGDLTIQVTGQETINGIPRWTLEFADTAQAEPGSCDPAAAVADQCQGNPNRDCDDSSRTCIRSKGLAQQVCVMQFDQQLRKCTDTQVEGLLILDGARQAAFSHNGHELLSNKTRNNPQPPEGQIQFKGSTSMTVPGTMPANAKFNQGDAGLLVEVFDGSHNFTMLTAYRITRAFYMPGNGLAFFQWEDVPSGFEASAAVGYLDAVLTGIDPPVP